MSIFRHLLGVVITLLFVLLTCAVILPILVLALLKGMSEAIGEYVKGGGSPTDGVVMAGAGGTEERGNDERL